MLFSWKVSKHVLDRTGFCSERKKKNYRPAFLRQIISPALSKCLWIIDIIGNACDVTSRQDFGWTKAPFWYTLIVYSGVVCFRFYSVGITETLASRMTSLLTISSLCFLPSDEGVCVFACERDGVCVNVYCDSSLSSSLSSIMKGVCVCCSSCHIVGCNWDPLHH